MIVKIYPQPNVVKNTYIWLQIKFMGKFIGRETEVELLKNALDSSKSELIAVYGRRRVGKTFLIRETFAGKMVLEVTGIYKGSFTHQLMNFYNEIKSQSTKFKKKDIPTNWMEAFNLLEKYLNSLKGKSKKVIFIDEFPWMHTHKSNFVSMFAHFWNTYCTKRKDLVVVLCGSAASFMVHKVINDKGGLHNRISVPIRLLPFNLHETELFLKSRRVNLDRYDYLLLYMAIGGIPHYLEKIKPGDSVPVAIDKLCFKQGGLLANEFNQVFASLFDDSQNHVKIVTALSLTRQGIGRDELARKTRVGSGGTFTKAINELIESGFVAVYQPFYKKKKEKLYRLSDEYSQFYLKFIKNNSGRSWRNIFKSHSYVSWTGFAFEILCLKHVEQIKKGLGLSGIDTQSAAWRNKKAQIDLVIDRADRCINVCEIKFIDKDYSITKSYAGELQRKKKEFINDLESRKNVFLTMVTTFNIASNKHSRVVDNFVTMDDLFERV